MTTPAPKTEKILPDDISQALNMMIRMTMSLCDIADRETQALAQNDITSFAILQDEKEIVAAQYAKASGEFRANLVAYRGADIGLLDRLENLQKDLGEKTKSNNKVVSQMYDRSQNKTQSALLAAQEIGQTHHVQMPTQDAVNENRAVRKVAGGQE